MSTEETLQQEAQLNEDLHDASKAKDVLENKTFELAWKTVRVSMLEELLNCSVRDKEGREYLWLSIKALDNVIGQLRSMIDSGTMAEHQLNSLHKSKD